MWKQCFNGRTLYEHEPAWCCCARRLNWNPILQSRARRNSCFDVQVQMPLGTWTLRQQKKLAAERLMQEALELVKEIIHGTNCSLFCLANLFVHRARSPLPLQVSHSNKASHLQVNEANSAAMKIKEARGLRFRLWSLCCICGTIQTTNNMMLQKEGPSLWVLKGWEVKKEAIHFARRRC